MTVDADGDGHLDDDYVPAAPGIDPGVARFSKTPKSTTTDCFRYKEEDKPMKDSRLHNKFMPGYGGFLPKEMDIKTSGGQWTQPLFLEVEAKAVRDARRHHMLYALAPPMPSHLRISHTFASLTPSHRSCPCTRGRLTCRLRTSAQTVRRGPQPPRGL